MDEKLKTLDEEKSESSSEIAETWNSAHEDLLAAIGDRSLGSSWMHMKCQRVYESINFWLTIPSIVVSTLAGSATMGMGSLFPPPNQQVASTCIGLFTIGCGVLTSINNFIKSSQFAETHRSASLAHAKLHRVIQSEVALRRDQRNNAQEFIKVVRAEVDRLHEISPTILDNVVELFRSHFKDRIDFEKPEIIGEFDHVHVNQKLKNDKQKTMSNLSTPNAFLNQNQVLSEVIIHSKN